MARYWIGHAAASAGIALAGLGLGWFIDSTAGSGTVPHLVQSAHAMADIARYGGIGVAILYQFRVPRVIDQERELELHGIGHDTARYRGLRRRERARRGFIEELEGPEEPDE